ncbi:MAG: hypothetical protein KF699_16865 [Phycisphaeraceae bacterium]|nr:hypothetical protein [Phycisphaeraceae bacterium]MBX3405859.1 hypothetical protein [Phycisphaeraceae bacterium]
MRATIAIFIDAYRELNSRKLFWVVLLISLMVVGMFACLGIDSRGFTFLHWSIGVGFINTAVMSEAVFYKQFLFTELGVKFWLGIIATILALVSTASIFPDLVSGGSIELVLSKPISRLRLFFTKYAAGLLFVTLQVGVFSVGSFLVIGFRGGVWEPRVLLAIPIVVLFFSYLFCVCALLGLLTRSSIASLLLTILIWFVVFILSASQTGVTVMRSMAEERVRLLEEDIARRERELERLQGVEQAPSLAAVGNSILVASKVSRLEDRRKRLPGAKSALRNVIWIDRGMRGVKAVLPKVSDTKDLLERAILTTEERERLIRDAEREMSSIDMGGDDEEIRVDMGKVQRQAIERKYANPVWWIVGTSLAFEAVVLGLCAWVFCRRDF